MFHKYNTKFCSECGAPTILEIPEGDNRERSVCSNCKTIHYINPKIVIGCVVESSDSKILLCKRAIEPRYGYWTVPAGFLEIGETLEEGAKRETFEEACAKVTIGHFFASVDIVYARQVHMFFTAKLNGEHAAGEESLESALFSEKDIPWGEIAFKSGIFALEKYFQDQGENHGVHHHEVKRNILMT